MCELIQDLNDDGLMYCEECGEWVEEPCEEEEYDQ
jgi:predicted nucleic acid-binding Zn ribbon protein